MWLIGWLVASLQNTNNKPQSKTIETLNISDRQQISHRHNKLRVVDGNRVGFSYVGAPARRSSLYFGETE